MADVSKVKINNTLYDVKDATARTDLATKAPLASPSLTGTPTAPTATSGTSTTQIATTAFAKGEADKKVSKSGDTMTGNLVIQKADYTGFYGKRSDVTIGTTPASDKGVSYWAGLDSNGAMISYAESFLDDNGDNVLYFQANNKDSGNNLISTAFSIRANTNGTRSVVFSHPAAWCDALGLGDSGWQSLTNNTKFTGTILYRKIGKLVEVATSDGITLKTALTSANIILAKLPSGYKPHAPVQSYAGNILNHACARIEINGDLYFHKPNDLASWATTSSIRFNFTYFVD